VKAWTQDIRCYAQINKTRDSESEGFSSSVKQENTSCTSKPNAGRGGYSGNDGRVGRGQGGCDRGNNAYLKENQRIPHGMGCDMNADYAGHGRTADEVVMAKEVAAEVPEPARICRGTIGSGKKIDLQEGDEAQEWTSRKKINLQEPAQVKATREQIVIKLRLKSLRAEKTAIEAEIIQAPTNCRLLKEAKIKLNEDEKVHINGWRCHQEKTGSIKRSRGKEYSLLLVLMVALIEEQPSILFILSRRSSGQYNLL
jgi:hypothetical protein